jgi:hypothetical protein
MFASRLTIRFSYGLRLPDYGKLDSNHFGDVDGIADHVGPTPFAVWTSGHAEPPKWASFKVRQIQLGHYLRPAKANRAGRGKA